MREIYFTTELLRVFNLQMCSVNLLEKNLVFPTVCDYRMNQEAGQKLAFVK